MKTKSNSLHWTGILAAAIIATPAANAALIAYEGFDYNEANGTSISGLNGGTGWDEAYPTPDGSHVLAAGLTFSTISSVGKSMTRSGGTLTDDGRNWDTTFSSTTYWYSFLVNSSGHEGTFNLFQSSGSNQNGTGIELRNSGGSTLIRATAGYAEDARTVAAGQTHLVLGHVSGDNNYLWVYAAGEDAPTEAPATNTALATVFGGALTGKTPAMSGRSFGSSSGPVTFDEIRIGTTFDSVVVPEPTSAALCVIGLAGLLRRRR